MTNNVDYKLTNTLFISVNNEFIFGFRIHYCLNLSLQKHCMHSSVVPDSIYEYIVQHVAAGDPGHYLLLNSIILQLPGLGWAGLGCAGWAGSHFKENTHEQFNDR